MDKEGDMRRLVRCILDRLSPLARRNRAADHSRASSAQCSVDAALAVHDAAAAITSGDHQAARHHLQLGLATGHHTPSLMVLAALSALAQGDPHTACDHLDRTHLPDDSSDLTTGQTASDLASLAHLLRTQTSRSDSVQLDLLSAMHRGDLSPVNRLLLAVLELRQNDPQAARTLLNHADLEHDGIACRLAALLDLLADSCAAHSASITDLLHAHPATDQGPLMLASLGVTPADLAPGVPLHLVEQLADELLRQPHIIASLLAAQRHNPRPQPHRIELLRRAIFRCVDRLSDPLPAIEAMSALALLAGDHDDAARWARRGLGLSPLAATFALLLDQADEPPSAGVSHPKDQAAEDHDTSGAVSPTAVDALRRAVAAHPTYPDLRRALIQRYQRQGMEAAARDQARNWLIDQPTSHLAQRTIEELAA
jgi:hypothetical protein